LKTRPPSQAIEGPAVEAFCYQPSSWFVPFDMSDIFRGQMSQDSPVHLDLGAGDGGFICARAKKHPEVRFLAIERLLGRVRKICKKAYRENIKNVRVLRIEGAYAVEHLFPKHSLDSITILFPDPWPKRRHHPQRLIQTSFLKHCASCLKPDGWLGIKTDDAPYFEHIQKVLSQSQEWVPWKEADAANLLPEKTDFETDFLKEGRTIHFVALRPNSSS
jgi:tRNA (guanine-N7-)-methyltransferase